MPCLCPTEGQPQRHNHPGQPAAHTGRLRDRHTPRHLTPPDPPPPQNPGAQIGLALEPGPHSQRSTEAGTQGWLLQSLAGLTGRPTHQAPHTPRTLGTPNPELWQLNPGRTDRPGPGAGAPAPPGGERRPGRQHPPQRPAHGGGPGAAGQPQGRVAHPAGRPQGPPVLPGCAPHGAPHRCRVHRGASWLAHTTWEASKSALELYCSHLSCLQSWAPAADLDGMRSTG